MKTFFLATWLVPHSLITHGVEREDDDHKKFFPRKLRKFTTPVGLQCHHLCTHLGDLPSEKKTDKFHLNLCLLGNFTCFFSSADFFFKVNFFEQLFQDYQQSAK